MFFPPLQWTFDVFNIHLITPKNQKLFIDQFRCGFTCVNCHLKDIQTLVLFNLLINNTPFKFNQWMQIIITLKKIRNNFFLSYSSMIALPCSWPISEDTRWKVLNLGSNIKESILWAFLFSFFLRRKEKNQEPK